MSYSLFPSKISLESYKFFLRIQRTFLSWLLNSLFVASVVTVSNVFFASMAGYAFSKIKFKGRTALFTLLFNSDDDSVSGNASALYILIVNIFQIQNTYSALSCLSRYRI